MAGKFDVLFISPWSEPINVLPSFLIIRQEIEACANQIARTKIPIDSIEKNGKKISYPVKKYLGKFPISMGLLSIASVLEQNGYTVNYVSLDRYKNMYRNKAGWLEKTLRVLLMNTRYAVGVTSVTPEFNRALKVLRLARKLNPKLLRVMGGHHVTYLDKESLENREIDVVVRGEGEITFLELLEMFIAKRDFSTIKGITFRKKNKIIRNPDRPLCDLTKIPKPALHLLPKKEIDNYVIYSHFSRGCSSRCDYCIEGRFWKNKKRFRELSDFIGELEFLSKEYKTRFVHLVDSDFIKQNEYIDELCAELENRNLNIFLSVSVSPDVHKHISQDRLKRMVKVGFVEFNIGSESVSDDVLEKIHRYQTFSGFLKSVTLLKAAKAPFVFAYWIIGLPGETRETIQETINEIICLFEKDLLFHGSMRFFIPYPGSKIYNEASKYGIKLITDDWERFDRFGFPPPYIHKNITPFELQNYMMLFQSIQLSYFLKRLNISEEHALALHRKVNGMYSKAIYM